MPMSSKPSTAASVSLVVRPGEQLRLAREGRGLSLEQIAAELHLLPRLLRALEADDYASLPEPGFVRGYIRQYARLLQLPEEDLVLRLDEAYQVATGHAPDEGLQHNPLTLLRPVATEAAAPLPLRWRRLAVLGLLLLTVLAVSWQVWLYVKNGALSTTASHVLEASSTLWSRQPASSTTEITPPASDTVDLPNTATTRISADALELRINADTRVSVRDANGQQLADGDKKAGDLLLLNGASPFSIELSQAAAVQLSFNGQPIDLSPYIVNGAVNFRLSR